MPPLPRPAVVAGSSGRTLPRSTLRHGPSLSMRRESAAVTPAARAAPGRTRAAARRAAGPGRAELAGDAQTQEAYDRLATMVAVVAADASCLLVNSALENAIGRSRRGLVGTAVLDWFSDPAPLCDALDDAATGRAGVRRFAAGLRCHGPGMRELPVHVVASAVVSGAGGAGVLLEMLEVERQVRIEREERMHGLVQAHQELLRNLAHEIGNPLGGIRGAAQLLALESRSPDLAEYADVIIREADRLRELVDQMLAPHRRLPVWESVNIHEVCEHVRMLVLAEFPDGLEIRRDYDTSLPELRGDRERLIQALLNIVRNAAQALAGHIADGGARIVLRTRVARQVVPAGRRCRLAIELQVEDNGPGFSETLRERIFQPLVVGRDGGCGLGLTIAQTFIQQHGGSIDCDSEPGVTRFTVVIPLDPAVRPPATRRRP